MLTLPVDHSTVVEPKSLDYLLPAALEACRAAAEVHRRYFRNPQLDVDLKADHTQVTRADVESEEAARAVLRAATPALGLFGEELPAEGNPRRRWILDPLDGTQSFIAGLPHFAVLLALEIDGDIALGVVHAPLFPQQDSGDPGVAAGETWWAVRGQGAFACRGLPDPDSAGSTPAARRVQVSSTPSLDGAFLTHGGLTSFQRTGLWRPFSRLVGSVRRTRGYGDWWGHMLVAEGYCDLMAEARVAYHDLAAPSLILNEAGGNLLTGRQRPLQAGFCGPALATNGKLSREAREVFEL